MPAAAVQKVVRGRKESRPDSAVSADAYTDGSDVVDIKSSCAATNQAGCSFEIISTD
jgi:hypothetical protein